MFSWVSVDLSTGRILADMPDLTCTRVASVIGAYTTTTATLPIPTAPEGWERATLHGATAMVLLDDPQDGTDPVPVWGGFVLRRQRTLRDVVNMSLGTIEAYLDRRFVGDVTYTAWGQNDIVADLIDQFVNDGTINIRVQASVGSEVRDRTYTDASDKSVYSVLTELMGVSGGPEWTIGWEWQHDPERITPVLYVGGADGSPTLGTSAPSGFSPAATFEAPGSVVDASFDEDYGKDKGADDVLASSSAVADVRPQSPRQVETTERPTFEHRFTPSTSITEIDTLTSHAQSALAQMVDGARALTLTIMAQDGPQLGVDWSIGDQVGYQLGGLVYDPTMTTDTDTYSDTYTDLYGASADRLLYPDGIDSVPAFPGGLSGVARCIGWELSLSEPVTVSPILALVEGV